MAKITIEELFYGDTYGMMGEVVKQVFARQEEFVADPHTFRELETVCQTLIAVEKMKKNGDCIAKLSRQCGHRFCMKGERKKNF